MELHTFIFIGRSGSGKGTQADQLVEYLKKSDPKHSIFRLETGKVFREFIEKKTYTSKLSHDIYLSGGLQPDFLSINMWSTSFIHKLKEEQHMIIDGSPRKLFEAGVLDSAIKFYNRPKPYVIYMNISRELARARLTERHRMDDTQRDIESRLNWFETDVVPTIEYYRKNPNYHFLDVHGDRSVQDVHKDIVSRIFG